MKKLNILFIQLLAVKSIFAGEVLIERLDAVNGDNLCIIAHKILGVKEEVISKGARLSEIEIEEMETGPSSGMQGEGASAFSAVSRENAVPLKTISRLSRLRSPVLPALGVKRSPVRAPQAEKREQFKPIPIKLARALAMANMNIEKGNYEEAIDILQYKYRGECHPLLFLTLGEAYMALFNKTGAGVDETDMFDSFDNAYRWGGDFVVKYYPEVLLFILYPADLLNEEYCPYFNELYNKKFDREDIRLCTLMLFAKGINDLIDNARYLVELVEEVFPLICFGYPDREFSYSFGITIEAEGQDGCSSEEIINVCERLIEEIGFEETVNRVPSAILCLAKEYRKKGNIEKHTFYRKFFIKNPSVLENYIKTKGDKDGNSLLILATSFGYTDICNLIVRNNVDVNKVSNIGTSPLLHAVRFGSREICELLLNHNADPNIGGNRNTTPLMLAAGQNKLDIARLLLEKGADCRNIFLTHNGINKSSNSGVTAYDIAKEKGYTEMCALLENWDVGKKATSSHRLAAQKFGKRQKVDKSPSELRFLGLGTK